MSLKGELSKPFDVQNGVKQGCVLAPTIFSHLSFQSSRLRICSYDKGVMIQSRLGANLFNANQFKSTTRTNPLEHHLRLFPPVKRVTISCMSSWELATKAMSSANMSSWDTFPLGVPISDKFGFRNFFLYQAGSVGNFGTKLVSM